MNTKMFFVALVVLASTLGCEGEMMIYATGTDCHVEPSTMMMQDTWQEADTYRRTCVLEVEQMEHICQYHLDESGMTYEECQKYTDQEYMKCGYFYGIRVNRMPLRECGVEVFHILVDYYDLMEGNLPLGTQIWEINKDDDDGDGISTWHEKWMGYNPCTPYSFGQCVPDSELDYDADGVPNGVDDANNPDGDGSPICNWDDSGHWKTDCV